MESSAGKKYLHFLQVSEVSGFDQRIFEEFGAEFQEFVPKASLGTFFYNKVQRECFFRANFAY
jgi:hypothetical protein